MTRLLTVVFIALCSSLYASTPDSLSIPTLNIFQELQTPGAQGAVVRIYSAPEITNEINTYTKLNLKKRSFTGYRIQIYSGNSSDSNIGTLQTMKKNFEEEFSDMPAYLQYFDPDFKIRVGNFRSRLDCIPALYRIRKKYPASYPVKTEITWNELNQRPIVEENTNIVSEP